jgi:hypothetical protein
MSLSFWAQKLKAQRNWVTGPSLTCLNL